jgi:hypothetical protein
MQQEQPLTKSQFAKLQREYKYVRMKTMHENNIELLHEVLALKQKVRTLQSINRGLVDKHCLRMIATKHNLYTWETPAHGVAS